MPPFLSIPSSSLVLNKQLRPCVAWLQRRVIAFVAPLRDNKTITRFFVAWLNNLKYFELRKSILAL
jgi:hypothetical protein